VTLFVVAVLFWNTQSTHNMHAAFFFLCCAIFCNLFFATYHKHVSEKLVPLLLLFILLLLGNTLVLVLTAVLPCPKEHNMWYLTLASCLVVVCVLGKQMQDAYNEESMKEGNTKYLRRMSRKFNLYESELYDILDAYDDNFPEDELDDLLQKYKEVDTYVWHEHVAAFIKKRRQAKDNV
jgi:uncharacterized membrane protein